MTNVQTALKDLADLYEKVRASAVFLQYSKGDTLPASDKELGYALHHVMRLVAQSLDDAQLDVEVQKAKSHLIRAWTDNLRYGILLKEKILNVLASSRSVSPSVAAEAAELEREMKELFASTSSLDITAEELEQVTHRIVQNFQRLDSLQDTYRNLELSKRRLEIRNSVLMVLLGFGAALAANIVYELITRL